MATAFYLAVTLWNFPAIAGILRIIDYQSRLLEIAQVVDKKGFKAEKLTGL
jgi:hypothetical protein